MTLEDKPDVTGAGSLGAASLSFSTSLPFAFLFFLSKGGQSRRV
jgi:hypothetical protein